MSQEQIDQIAEYSEVVPLKGRAFRDILKDLESEGITVHWACYPISALSKKFFQ